MLSILAGEITAADAARQFKVSEQSIGVEAAVPRRRPGWAGVAEAERTGGAPLASLLPVNTETGQIRRIKLVTDNGGAFKGVAFARFTAARPELLHFGSLKYEHLYRAHEQIATVEGLCREAETYRAVLNEIRPHDPRHPPTARGATRSLAPPDPQASNQRSCVRSLTRDNHSPAIKCLP